MDRLLTEKAYNIRNDSPFFIFTSPVGRYKEIFSCVKNSPKIPSWIFLFFSLDIFEKQNKNDMPFIIIISVDMCNMFSDPIKIRNKFLNFKVLRKFN